MKILVVDDQARRYGRLADELLKVGVKREQMDLVSCANTAREYLNETYYDVVILDILLPLWPEGQPDVQHSLDLLFDIHEGGSSKRPGHIVGVTADMAFAGQAAAKFGEWTWTVVQYSESSDEWINRIRNCVSYVVSHGQTASKDTAHGVDLAIVCALNKPELEEVLRLPWEWSSPRPISDLIFVHDGRFVVEGREVSVCATAAPRMGMVSTALLTSTVTSILRPKLIAMCGICAGVRGKVNLGDVLFADPAWDFQSGKRVRDKSNSGFSISPHQLHPSELIRTHVYQISMDRESLSKISTSYGSDAPGATRLIIGPVASGSAVLADGEVVEEIKSQHRGLIGVEMEIYGLYAAAAVASAPQPQAFALKGVCDFADPDKEDKNQRYAAYASANVLSLLMQRFAIRLLH